MPVVDGVVVLNAGISALPRSPGHLVEQFTGVHRLDNPAIGARTQGEITAVLDGSHELICHTYRVIGVLVLDRRDVAAAQIHVESGVAQRADLVFLAGFGLDEFLNVGVIHVEHHHLGSAAGRPTGLDGSRTRVCTPHERDRAGRGATRAEQLLRGADPGKVQAGT